MNVTGLNMSTTIATAVNAEAIPGLPVALAGENSLGFTAELTTQLGLLNQLNMQTELSQASNSMLSTPVSVTQADAPAELNTETTAVRPDFAALMGDSLPVSYKVNEDPSADPHLAVVTDAINYMAAKPASGTAITATPVSTDTEDAIAESIGQSFLPQTPLTKVVVNSSAKPQTDKKELPDSEVENTQSATVMALVSPSVVATINTPLQTQSIESTEASATTTLPSAKSATAAIDTNLVTGKDAELKSPDLLNQNATGEKAPQSQFTEDGKMMFEEQKPATDKITNDGDVGSRAAVDFTKLDKLVPSKADVPAINKPLNHPDWGKDVGDRIVWMNNKSLPSAEIRINPEHLGPITVRIDVSQDQATVSFTAQHGIVRDALEASIPKLKEMMAAQNLDLATVSVAQQQSSSHQGQSQAQNFFQMDKQGQNNSASPMDELNTVTEELDESQVTVTKGLLSMYA